MMRRLLIMVLVSLLATACAGSAVDDSEQATTETREARPVATSPPSPNATVTPAAEQPAATQQQDPPSPTATATVEEPAASQQPVAADDEAIEAISTLEDVRALSWEEYDELCDALAEYGPEEPVIEAFHDRLGQDGSLNDSTYLACVVHARNPPLPIEIQESDLHERSEQTAQTATFELYDLTWVPPTDLVLSQRTFSQANPREAPNQIFVYSTTYRGGFSGPYSSEQIFVRAFDTAHFPELDSNCGPRSMTGPSDFFDNTCEPIGIEIDGQPVYSGESAYGATYVVTFGTTRIRVERARDPVEAIAILESAIAAETTEIVWFLKR